MDSDVADVASLTITSDQNSNSGMPKGAITLPMNCTNSSRK